MPISIYKDHPVRVTLTRIIELQKSPEFSEPTLFGNEQVVYARDKVFAMTHAIQALLLNTPAELASIYALNQLQTNLQPPFNELISFTSDRNSAHIENAATQFEQSVLPNMWGLFPHAQALPQNALADLISAHADASLETVRQLTEKRDELAAKLQSLTDLVDAQTTRLEALTEGAAKERAEAAATVAKLEQSFAQKETERASTFEDALAQLRDDFQDFEGQSKSASATLLKQLDDHRIQAATIVQVVGNIGATGNYQKIANSESRNADIWRWITVGIFALGVLVAIITLIRFWGEPFNSETAWSVVIRLLYAIAITAPAWYAAKESARHRTNADRARQTELELASIGPFIELMPEEKKIAIREQLTRSYFGKDVEPHTASQPISIGDVKDLFSELTKILKR